MAGRRRAERAFEGLLRRVAVGQWVAGRRLPPVRELEREFGVSHMTMLAALRLAADQGLVAVHPRRPVVVLAGAREQARRLLAGRAGQPESRRVALMVPDCFWPADHMPFFGDIIAAIRREAAKMDLAVQTVRWPLTDQVAFAHGLADRGFGAAFALGVRAEYLAALYVLQQQRFPVVVFNVRIPQLSLPAVTIDEYGGAQQLAAILAGLGHRNLCLVSYACDMRLVGDRHRVMGWLDYLEEAGLMNSCLMPVHYLPPREDAIRHFVRILTSADCPTAMVFAYGLLYQRFADESAHRRIRVPEQVSTATFDAIMHASEGSWRSQVTTASIDMKRAAQCILELVEETMKGNLQPRSIRVPMHIHMTGSIGPPPSAADSGRMMPRRPSEPEHAHGRANDPPPGR